MTAELSGARLDALSALIAERLGLHLPAARLGRMQGQLSEAARDAGFSRAGEFIDALSRDRRASGPLEALVPRLTVGETYFYREPGALAAVAEHFLPDFARRRSPAQPPRCWSAGCCTGEEAYSLAITLERAGFPAPAHAGILATDLNPRFLRQAREGVYRSWSFRNAPAWLRPGYFRPLDEERAEIRESLRRAVRFTHLNLAEAAYPAVGNGTAEIDLILCRNVLMYFTPEVLARAVRRLADSLAEGGWLVVGAAETGHVDVPELAARRFGEVTVFEKQGGRASVAPAVFPAAAPARTEFSPAAAPVNAARPDAYVHPAGFPVPTLDDVRRLAGAGNSAAALAACDDFLRRHRTAAVAHFLRASVLIENGAAREAEESLRSALFLDPDLVAAHLLLA